MRDDFHKRFVMAQEEFDREYEQTKRITTVLFYVSLVMYFVITMAIVADCYFLISVLS